MFELAYPYLLLLLPIPLLMRRLSPFEQSSSALRYPLFKKLINELGITPKKNAYVIDKTRIQTTLAIITWLLLVIAVAKPIWHGVPVELSQSGRDLMVAVDLSTSMQAKDFTIEGVGKINRLDMVKRILNPLVKDRKGDRLGLILFGTAPYLQVPLTLDHRTWQILLNESQISMAGHSTVIGDAIGLAIKLFEESNAQSRMLILLTDGNDSGSKVPPIEAAKIASRHGVTIYPIAIGNPETSGEEAINVDILAQIAQLTGGKHFRAFNEQELLLAKDTINNLEKQLFSTYSYRPKYALHYIPIGLAFLLNCLVMLYFIFGRKSSKLQQTIVINEND